MRKVTASAVLLTALTGCNQSAPSTQWSFEVPTSETASDAQTDGVFKADADATVLPLDTQATASKTYRDGMMGPAFEQPAQTDFKSARISAVTRPHSQQQSGTIAQSPNWTKGASTPANRQDPVAQVRSYLRASASPSALVNRQPYSSEVYFSGLSTSQSPSLGFVPSAIPAVESANSSAPTSTISSFGGSRYIPTPSLDAESNLSTAGRANGDASDSLRLLSSETPVDTASRNSGEAVSGNTLLPSEGIATSFSDNSLASSSSSIVPSSGINNVNSEGLPLLSGLSHSSEPIDARPSFTDNADSQPTPETASIALQPPEESVPIGTAILRDLERPSAHETSAPFPEADDVAYTPVSTSAERAPTLASLSRGVQYRELSPLVESFRSSSSSFSSETVLPTAATASEFGAAPAAGSYESMSGTEAIFESLPSAGSGYEVDLHSDAPLQGQTDFSSSQGVAPIYEPIDAVATLSSSASLLSKVLSTLNNEALALGSSRDIPSVDALLSLSAKPVAASTREASLLMPSPPATQRSVSLERLLSGIQATEATPGPVDTLIPETNAGTEDESLSFLN